MGYFRRIITGSAVVVHLGRPPPSPGGNGLLPATREDLRLVVALLKNSFYTEEVGRRLHAVAAEFGRLAGWLAYECGQPTLAQRYFLAALRAAHVSGDRAVGANILGYMSVQAAQSDTPRDAVVLMVTIRAHRHPRAAHHLAHRPR